MTDLETMKAMLNRACVEFSQSTIDKQTVVSEQLMKRTRQSGEEIEFLVPVYEKYINNTLIVYGEGYAGFFTVFEFDELGQLVQLGAYE